MKTFIVVFLDANRMEIHAEKMEVRDGAVVFSRHDHEPVIVSLAGLRWTGSADVDHRAV